MIEAPVRPDEIATQGTPPESETVYLLAQPQAPSRDVLERLVARQQYEQRFAGKEGKLTTGNDVLRAALAQGSERVIASPDALPEGLHYNEALLASFDSPHNRAAQSVFLESVTSTIDSQIIVNRFFAITDEPQAYFPILYGTSGTELNSKEVGNTLGMVQSLRQAGREVVGIYFVEDKGHPMFGTLAEETKRLEAYVLGTDRIRVTGQERTKTLQDLQKEASDLVEKGFVAMYGGEAYSFYDPQEQAVQSLLQFVPNEDQSAVLTFFAKAHGATKRRYASKLSVPGAALPAPKDEAVRYAYSLWGFPEQQVDQMARVAAYLEANPSEFPQPSLADYRTIVQGVMGMQIAYEGYGAENMPLWAVDTWEAITKRSQAKDAALTIGKAKALLSNHYPDQNRRVVNFACPACASEHGISDTTQEDEYKCGFNKLVPAFGAVPLKDWVWGGNSGAMYYELLPAIREHGEYGFHMDNYEANGPQSVHAMNGEAPFLLPPNNRTWTNDVYAPHNATGELDGNAALGTATSTELYYAYLQTVPMVQRQRFIQDWFATSGEIGLENNCAVAVVGFGEAKIQSFPYDMLRNWQELSVDTRYDDFIDSKYSREEFQQLFDAALSNTALDLLVAGFAGQEIAQTVQLGNEQSAALAARIAVQDLRLATIESKQAAIGARLEQIDQLGEQGRAFKNPATLKVALRERDRIINRRLSGSKFNPDRDVQGIVVQQAVAAGYDEAFLHDPDLLSRLQAEVFDIWAEDAIEGKVMVRQLPIGTEEAIYEAVGRNKTDLNVLRINRATKAEIKQRQALGEEVVTELRTTRDAKALAKRDMEHRFHELVRNEVASDPEYQAVMRELAWQSEQIDGYTLRKVQHKDLETSKKEILSQRAKLLGRIKQIEQEQQALVWQVISAIGAHSGVQNAD